jgi:hypothetical protein
MWLQRGKGNRLNANENYSRYRSMGDKNKEEKGRNIVEEKGQGKGSR